MKLLAVMRPAAERDVREAVMARARTELEVLWRLYRDGVVREMYSPGGPGIVLVLEAGSVDEARRRLGELPLLRDRIMALELVELHPFRALQMLFADKPDDSGSTEATR
jgi:hypothetical protein